MVVAFPQISGRRTFIDDAPNRFTQRIFLDEALKQAIREGLNSGISDKSVTEIMNKVDARLRADGRL